MLKKIDARAMFLSNQGWLQSRFHFSFAEYTNYDNIKFGVLRVLNDDIIQAHQGFDKHPHKDMEIISYIVNGHLSHEDSMGNKEVLSQGEVQYMSAGTGIIHSEMNESNEAVRLLQIWIIPPKKGLQSLYGSHKFKSKESHNRLLNIVSSQKGTAPIKIYQDINIFVSKLDKNKQLEKNIGKNRQVYFVQIEGSSTINGTKLNEADAIKITQEEQLIIHALNNSHFLFIEMKVS